MKDHKPRQHNRYKISTAAQVRKIGTENWFEVGVVTLSPMGACFTNTGAFTATDQLEFFMAAPNPTSLPYHLAARVVWVRDGQVGVEFTGNM